MPPSKHAAVVTGSTSGVGLAIALRLIRAGYQVTLNYAVNDAHVNFALAAFLDVGPGALLVEADVGTAASSC